ncbi:hypothetical protein JAAARDRAFT_203281 [Jaapia argillacea MUCL 33604]|uniref:F-box domain-containing protein n=1 Tax=Jaapia argillacea MUCL 33604 TaxID=933084 RepID=A0A067Q767_9AGAM|nr:hypothetical protein JAAARDRAFT_203281 [Jaapia argillacea MUCL 33604]
MHHLQEIDLSLPSLSATELALLAGLGSLARLSIRARKYQDITVQQLRSLCSEPFTALRHLTTEGLDLESCTALLLWISPSRLQELTSDLDPFAPVSTISFERFIDAVGQSCSHTSLSHLQVIAPALNYAEPPLFFRVQATSLRPLLAFGNLATVVIDPPIFIVMDDSILQEMALAWPDLETLSIGIERHSLQEYRVTLPGLIPLAQHCPRLKKLGVVLHATADINEVKLTDFISVSSVDSLQFAGSTITPDRAMEVAAYLSALFPKVDHCGLSAGEVNDCEMSDAWQEVCRACPVFAMVREQERRRQPK